MYDIEQDSVPVPKDIKSEEDRNFEMEIEEVIKDKEKKLDEEFRDGE